MSEPLRKSGIEPLGDVPWGTHFCHFFGSADDLLETLVAYFKAGIEGGESCLWLVDAPLTADEAWEALQRSEPEFDDYRRRGGVEFASCRTWYTRDGVLAVDGAVASFDAKLAAALARGFVGLRVSGCETWLPRADWGNFMAFEQRLDAAIAGRRMIISCSYPLATSGATEVLDVAHAHQLAVAKREGRWEVVETPDLRQAKADLDRLNRELEQRVTQRTAQLQAANDELRRARADAETALTRLRAVHMIIDSALAHLGVEELMSELLTRLRDALHADYTGILLLDDEETSFTTGAAAGDDAELLRGVRIPLDSSIGRVAREERGLILDELPGDEASEWAWMPPEVRPRLPRSSVGVPLRAGGRVFGVVVATSLSPRRFTADNLELLALVAERVAPGIERGRLLESLRAGRQQQQELSRRLLVAQEEERRRLAVELHDQAGQLLTSIKIHLESLVEVCAAPAAQARLAAAISGVDEAMGRVRDLALDLRPAVLDDLGLPAALRWYVDRFARTAGLEAHLAVESLPRLDRAVETSCFRVAQEALTNVARHARARRVWVEVRRAGKGLELRVRDDGVGFDVAAAGARGAAGTTMGLLGMMERCALVGGTLEVHSQPGKGTEILARFPSVRPPEESA